MRITRECGEIYTLDEEMLALEQGVATHCHMHIRYACDNTH